MECLGIRWNHTVHGSGVGRRLETRINYPGHGARYLLEFLGATCHWLGAGGAGRHALGRTKHWIVLREDPVVLGRGFVTRVACRCRKGLRYLGLMGMSDRS